MLDGDGMLVFPNEYGFGVGECGYMVLGFCAELFLITDAVLLKGIVHVVGGRENVVTGLFKSECGGCHVTIDRCSGKKVIRLGSC